jgi:hypothetical protein
MKDFNPGAGDGRRVGVPDNGLLEREPQHNRGALLWLSIASAPPRCRLVTTLCVRRGISIMRDSRNRTFGFHVDETIQLALIPRFFDFVRSGP